MTEYKDGTAAIKITILLSSVELVSNNQIAHYIKYSHNKCENVKKERRKKNSETKKDKERHRETERDGKE